MPANVPELGAVSTVGGQFTHNVFRGAQKKLEHRNKVAGQAALQQRVAARRAYYSDVTSTVRAGRSAFNDQARAAASQARTMQQQRNYAHGQAITEQKRRDTAAARASRATLTTPPTPSLAPAFSHAPSAQSPSQGRQQIFSHGPNTCGSITPQRIPAATFSHQLPGGAPQSHSAPVSPAFSHAATQTPTASVPRSPRGVTSVQFSHPEL